MPWPSGITRQAADVTTKPKKDNEKIPSIKAAELYSNKHYNTPKMSLFSFAFLVEKAPFAVLQLKLHTLINRRVTSVAIKDQSEPV